MLHAINPLVDFVFKRLFGAPENLDLLCSLLNGLLQPRVPIVELALLNPYTESEFQGDGRTVVDVKARDADGWTFQVEVQAMVRARLIPRMLYSAVDLYQSQLSEGQDYSTLRPVVALWILDGVLFRESTGWHHRFELWDPGKNLRMTDHLQIHTVELPRWRPEEALDDGARWVYFLREARNWKVLPEVLRTPELEKAMAVLNRISQKQVDYLQYQARQNFLREERAREAETERALADEKKAWAAAEQALAAKARAEGDAAAMRARLRALGLEPDEA